MASNQTRKRMRRWLARRSKEVAQAEAPGVGLQKRGPVPFFVPPPADGLLGRIAREGQPDPAREATITQLVAELEALGVRPGELLLVEGGQGLPASLVVEALLACLGPEGTLVAPALTCPVAPAELPLFHVELSPSLDPLGEALRHHPEARRSLHPTHSAVAVGPLAAALTDGHAAAPTPCGVDTPYYAALTKGRLLTLGSDLTEPMLLQVAAQLNDHPDHFLPGVTMATVISRSGRQRRVPVRLVGESAGLLSPLLPLVGKQGAVAEGTVGDLPAFLLEGALALEVARACLSTDPFYFRESLAR